MSILATAMLLVSTIVNAQEQEAPQITLITNVSVWDGTSDKVVSADVLVENNLIKEIKSNISAPSGATVIDGNGGTLTPGLIDMHTHIMLNGPKAFYTGQQDYDAFTVGAWAYQDMNMPVGHGLYLSERYRWELFRIIQSS